MINHTYGGRQSHSTSTGQQQEPTGTLYESFTPANHIAFHNGYNTPAFPSDNLTWVSGVGLPDDDDPLLQHRLLQLVEHHNPSSSRNVLRELADVAEQQSTPSGNKRRGSEDIFSEGEADHGRCKPLRKQPKSMSSASSSHARKQMDEVLAKHRALRQSIWCLEAQLSGLKEQLSDENAKVDNVQNLLQVTSEELVDELLEENSSWNQMYFHLVDFRNRFGHLRIPWRKDWLEKEPIIARLGPWLVQQRKDYRRSLQDPERLEPYKIIALERLNIEWDPSQQHWYNRFEELKRYKEEHGDCRVPYCIGKSFKKSRKDDESDREENEFGDGDGHEKVKYDSLGVWVKRQRNQYKHFKSGNKEKAGDMSEERISLLESIGFEWSLRSQSWADFFDELQAFKDKHGHTRVEEKDNKPLFDWLNRMRGFLKKYSNDRDGNELTPEQFALLQDLEIDSSLRERKFERRFRELMNFKESHGHCIVPTKYAANQKLSNWVQTQKRQYKLMKDGRKSQMTEEKCQMLRDAGFEFEVSKERKSEAMKQMDKSWDEYFADLQQYKAKYGQVNCIKQRKLKALRDWCDEQRVQHTLMKWGKTCAITDAQVHSLTQLGFVWEAAETPSKGWDDYFGDLMTFYLENSTFIIPDHEIDLKHWIDTQKKEYAKFVKDVPSLLTKSQVTKLVEVSFPFDGERSRSSAKKPVKHSWEEMFVRLLAFRIQQGSFCVPVTMKELHLWTCEQRGMLNQHSGNSSKRSAIWEERFRKLSRVGFFSFNELPNNLSVPSPSSRFSADAIDNTDEPPRGVTHTGAVTNTGRFILPMRNPTLMMPEHATEFTSMGRLALNHLETLHSNVESNGKNLASQAAQIVASINNRACATVQEFATTREATSCSFEKKHAAETSSGEQDANSADKTT